VGEVRRTHRKTTSVAHPHARGGRNRRLVVLVISHWSIVISMIKHTHIMKNYALTLGLRTNDSKSSGFKSKQANA